MILQATLSNPQRPEYGQVTVPFPIPRSEYDHIIEMLEQLEIGDALQRDCQTDEIVSELPILKRLGKVAVNLDEMDYLAKRLDSFDCQEKAQFQAMAVKLGTFDMTDLINLTFCCQQATVITDFSDLSKVGLRHFLTVNGGASQAELEKTDFHSVALDLIRTEEGHITPFGVVYDNGMQLEQIYDGRHFPEYLHDDPLMTMEVVEQQESSPVTPTWLHLPMSQRQIERALQRAGIQSVDADYEITGNTLPPHIAAIAEHSHDGINLLNRMCRAISVLDDEDRRKLDAAVDFAKSASASEITHFAENLDQVYDYEKYGQQRMERESGAFTEQGYIAYRGTLPIDERMAEAPPEQGFQLGGMM